MASDIMTKLLDRLCGQLLPDIPGDTLAGAHFRYILLRCREYGIISTHRFTLYDYSFLATAITEHVVRDQRFQQLVKKVAGLETSVERLR